MAIKVPDGTNYTEIDSGGHVIYGGTGTPFLDERGVLQGAAVESPASDIVWSNAEGVFQYKNTATTGDYLVINIQLNHDRKLGAVLKPHLHWEQTTSGMPNWVIQYRYQKQGAAKTTAWTNAAHTGNAFTYTSGTLNQITLFGSITPTTGDGVSDILQIRLVRDTANTLTLFAGTESLGTMNVMDFDIHKELDSPGSDEEYTK